MKDDSGSAFPVHDDAADMPGMSLRDWFATHALSGLIVRQPGGASWLAHQAYELADAMLEERRASNVSTFKKWKKEKENT